MALPITPAATPIEALAAVRSRLADFLEHAESIEPPTAYGTLVDLLVYLDKSIIQIKQTPLDQ